METATAIKIRKRRSRSIPTKTTGILRKTEQDARGFSEALCRYGELPTEIFGAFYNLANGNAPTSHTFKDRLTDLIHEDEGMSAARRIMYRPEFQKRYGLGTQAIYRKTLGTALNLYRFRIYDDQMVRWANTTQVMVFDRDKEASPHDKELSIVAASIEIEMRKYLKFASHIDILKTASEAAQNADSPLAIPIPRLSHQFEKEPKPTVITNTYLKPDFLCGAGYANDLWKFYALEYDRSNEDGEPTRNLHKQSLLRKILTYSAISTSKHPIYETYLHIPNLLVLFVLMDPRREAHFHRLVNKYATYPSQFLTKVIAPFDPILDPDLMPHLFTEPWHRADGSRFSLKTGKEVV